MEREKQLKSKLNDEFLSTIVEAAKVCGSSVDYVEVMDFVEWIFSVAEKPCPDLTSYDVEEE